MATHCIDVDLAARPSCQQLHTADVTRRSRARRAAVAPTVAAPERYLARLGCAFVGTVWVGGYNNWYAIISHTSPVAFPQNTHQGVLREGAGGRFPFNPSRQGD